MLRLNVRFGSEAAATELADRYAEIGLGKERAERLVPRGEASKAGLSISFHSTGRAHLAKGYSAWTS